MRAVAGGRSEFYRMDAGLAFVENAPWHVKAEGLGWNERNKEKAKRLLQEAAELGMPVVIPRAGLCTDNGAMIGAAAARRFEAGERAGLDLDARPSLPLASR